VAAAEPGGGAPGVRTHGDHLGLGLAWAPFACPEVITSEVNTPESNTLEIKILFSVDILRQLRD
ncbi:hypothetical protein ACWDG1_29950, partial [Streptomyces sp. NPDC001177]